MKFTKLAIASALAGYKNSFLLAPVQPAGQDALTGYKESGFDLPVVSPVFSFDKGKYFRKVIRQICDRATILKRGKSVWTGAIGDLTQDITSEYLGA